MAGIAPHVAMLIVHIGAGAAALALGPAAVLVRAGTGLRRRLAAGYQVAVAALTVSAAGLVAMAPARLWWLLPIAAATEVAALSGWRSRRRAQPAGGPADGKAVRLLGGSYVSLITAAAVVSWGGALAWIVPSLAGLLLVETAASPAGRRLLTRRVLA